MSIGPISHQGGAFDAGEAPDEPREVGGAAPVAPASGPGSPAAVADQFYRAFRVQDTAAMEKLYAPGVKFEDAAAEEEMSYFASGNRRGAALTSWRNRELGTGN